MYVTGTSQILQSICYKTASPKNYEQAGCKLKKTRSFNKETKSWPRSRRHHEEQITLELKNTLLSTNKELKGLNNGTERLPNLNGENGLIMI